MVTVPEDWRPNLRCSDIESGFLPVSMLIALVQLLEHAIESAEDGRLDDAVVSLTELIELEPDDTDILALAHASRSFALGELGRLDAAVADATVAIELEPDDTDTLAKAYGNRAVALRSLGWVDEAIADATAAIELEPDDTDTLALAYGNRAVALRSLGRLDEAVVADLRRVVDVLPSSHELRLFAEQLLRELGADE